MKTVGVIAECNPMHAGHASLLAQLRGDGFDGICVVLSGNYVQRGEIALFDKWVRTKALLACGADLVIELPTPYCLGGAAAFAKGGVGLLNALGFVNALAFGSECGDIALLKQAADLLYSPQTAAQIKLAQKQGKSYPRAISETANQWGGLDSDLFAPNNILGVEYLRALQAFDSPIIPVTYKRPTRHDADALCGLALRQRILAGQEVDPALFAPGTASIFAAANPFDPKRGALPLLTCLKRMEKEDFAKLPQVSEGLENKLYQAARAASSLDTFYQAVKCKRYPLARLRRIVMAAFLGVEQPMLADPCPPYLRVLGMNQTGKEMLHLAKPALPVSGSLKRLEESGERAKAFAKTELRATDLTALFASTPLPPSYEYTAPCVIV